MRLKSTKHCYAGALDHNQWWQVLSYMVFAARTGRPWFNHPMGRCGALPHLLRVNLGVSELREEFR